MSQETYFESYMEIVAEGIRSLRKISFKKINVINELISKLEGIQIINVQDSQPKKFMAGLNLLITYSCF